MGRHQNQRHHPTTGLFSGRKNGAALYSDILLEPNTARGIDSVRAFRRPYPASEAKMQDAVANHQTKALS
ncbi:hypothetical protein BLA27_09685 [Brucella cytisi]|uniref:Uncharacterized protein n=1 Tax=Brucella cytisi TaxID=407152 RepID=A0A1J6HKR7_9HYPH|nr:hypothetical protein BLA27_09685 [Brucella cytisi]